MSVWWQKWIVALWGALGVGCGAFGAHGLKDILDTHYLQIWETSVRYHLYASLFLLILWIANLHIGNSLARTFTWMVVGNLIFSLSLYLLALTSWKILGAITPIGGVLMIWAWVSLLFQKSK